MIKNAMRSVARRIGYPPAITPPTPLVSPAEPFSAVGRSVFNKAGRMVVKGTFSGEPIKIYEAATIEHAQLIEWASGHPDLNRVLPAIKSRRQRLLFVQWVPGSPLDFESSADATNWLNELLELQLRLHRTALPAGMEAGFDYWQNLILPRFERFAPLFDLGNLSNNVRDLVANVLPHWSLHLQHPDLTHRNVVVGANGLLWIIDNDVLSAGRFPLMDVCNTVNALPLKHRQSYWDEYLKCSATTLDRPTIQALEAFWLARSIGGLCSGNRFHQASATFQRYLNGKSILPITVKETTNTSSLQEYIDADAH